MWSLLLVLFTLSAKSEFQENYSFSGGLNSHWKTYGSATVVGNYVQLTSEQKGQKGAIWTTEASNLDNWEVTLSVYIGGGSGAEGFAFWYAKEPGFLGNAFGSKERYKGLCVFFDSFDNDGSGDNPSLNIAFNDNEREHDASFDGRSVRIAHHSVNLRATSTNAFGIMLWKKIRLTFTSAARSGTGANLFEVALETQFGSGAFNKVLSTSALALPASGFYFGVSASTGELTDYHRIKEFYVTGTPMRVAEEKATRAHENSKEMTGYKAVYADLSFALPRELIEVRSEATNEEKMMARTFNHILLRQYAYYVSAEGKFDTYKDILHLFESQNNVQIEHLKSDFHLANFKTSVQMESTENIVQVIEKVKGNLESLSNEMKTAKQNDNILRSNKDALKSYEYVPEDVAVGWTFYFLALVCFAQVALIGLWINSGLKKKSLSSLVI